MANGLAQAPLPGTRRAVALDAHGDPAVMRIVSEPVQPPPPGHVLVGVEAIGVNFGDILVRRGTYRPSMDLSVRPGFEVAGHVLAAGEGVDDRPTGMRVAAFTDDGGYADVVCVPADRVYPTPTGMSATQAAAAFIHGVTAWYAVHRFGRVATGEHVLVHAGAGGVGGLTIQLAREAGALPVATASTPDKRATALDYGAVAALDSHADDLKEALRDVTGDGRVDVVVDSVGGPLFDRSVRRMRAGGRYVVVGAASGEPATIDVRRLLAGTFEISGFVVAQVCRLDPREPMHAFEQVWELLSSGRLRVPMRTLRLEEVVAAHELLESRTLTGKIVLTTGREGP